MKRQRNIGVDRIVRLRNFAVGLAVFAALLLLPPSQSTHAWPGDLFLAWSSPELDNSRSVAWGDWDGDGDLDLAVGSLDAPVRVYRSEGGNLSLAWSASIETDRTFAVAWGDWDNDGDPDLAVGSGYGDPNRVYRNDGGSLILAWSSTEADDTMSVAWGDWDNDGDLDLAVGNDLSEPNQVYRNEGGDLGSEPVWSSEETDSTQSVAWGDWDNDGDLDLAVGNGYGDPNRVYRNEGGTLTSAWLSEDEDDPHDVTHSVAWGDWDGDGDLDLAVGNSGFGGEPNRVYRNEGGDLSLAWSSPEEDDTQSVAWGDWDDDGGLDLAVGNDEEVNRVYRNEGGSLTLAWSSLEADRTNSVAWGDSDGDGDLDLAVANRDQPDRVYRNEGGSLGLAWSSLAMDETSSLAWGDWDGDGDLDLAVGNDGQPNRVYRNEGDGLRPIWFSPEADNTHSVAWGDWDGDGDLDLAVGNYNEPNRVYRNDGGSLVLDWSSLPIDGGHDDTYSVAWGDWDNDGDLDLAVGNEYFDPSRVYENDGGDLGSEPAWSQIEDEWLPDETRSVAWGDWDGDGDLDLVLGNNGGSNKVYRNDGGDLGWDPIWSSPEADYTRGVAWGDWDGDGDLDLAAGNYSHPDRVYENDGSGLDTALTTAWSSAEEDNTLSVAWGDWDGDGDLDLAAGNYSGQPNRVYRNEGGDLALAWSSPQADYTACVAWGDWDRDGDLDLAVGNEDEPNRVYRNQGGALTVAWSSEEAGRTSSVAWGDWDRDGDLDLAVGEYNQANRVYRNDAGRLIPIWESTETDYTRSVAWGDWDNDGDLDLAVGNGGQANRVYQNDGGSLVLAWSSEEDTEPHDDTDSVAWGDWDGDGDLDLAVGNSGFGGEPNRVHRNEGGDLGSEPAWSSEETDYTRGVAWGDWDGDGDLDLAVGNDEEPNRVYRNDGGNLALAWSSAETDESCSLAWADWDGDGDLDLAVGNSWDQPDRLYRNEGQDLVLAWSSPAMDGTHSLAWGDWDGDGDLDLATGGDGDPNRVYRNDGENLVLTWSSSEKEYTGSVAWGDWDGDGDLDLIAGNSDQPNRVYRNHAMEGPTLPDATTKVRLSYPGPAAASFYASPAVLEGPTAPISYTLFDAEGDPARFVKAYYSLDGGGQWRPAVATGDTITTDLATDHRAGTLSPVSIPDGDVLASPLTLGGTGKVEELELTLSISHPQNSQLAASLQAPWPVPTGTSVLLFEGVGGDGGGFDSLVLSDGAARSIAALAGVTTTVNGAYRPVEPLSRFRGAPLGTPFTLVITDSVAGGTGILEEWRLRSLGAEHLFTWDIWASGVFGSSDNVVFRLDVYQGFASPGPYQHPFFSGQTLPFRVRGNQVRVVSGGEPLPNALVYRQPAGESDAYLPYSDLWGQPFRSDPAGYLQGRGEIGQGDRLVALAPIAATESYTLYHTNAIPTDTGLDAYTVTQMGVQTLTVSAEHPLLLFDLDVSLEWDARNDEQYLSQLVFDLQRTSEFLYDWSNGQAALGGITVHHDRERWNDAHVRVYASNRLRPNAAQGGIVTGMVTETVSAGGVITYTAGQVRMGAVWNRYGEAGGNPGEDWPRSLAHELGHYALYLDDNYLGFDANGLLIPVEGCASAMSDPYRDDYSEFHPDENWLPVCEETLSNQLTGRSDWGTVMTFYPALDGVTINLGPTGLPLAVSQIEFVEPVTPTAALENPVFYVYQDGHHVQPGSGARVFLYQGEWATDLGRPVVDQVVARGAAVGDRVCLYELAVGRLGCETISALDEQLELLAWPDWQPDLMVTPVNSVTIALTVTEVEAGLPLWARLYPATDPAPPAQALSEAGGEYAATFTLAAPAPEGYVQVWVAEGEARREVVTDYAIGGNPAFVRGRGAFVRGRGAFVRGRGAPAMSADGQAIVFGEGLEFGEEQFVVLQAASAMPLPPPWATVVGQAYRLSVSPEEPDLSGASISFSYMGNEVPAGEEAWLRVYRWQDVAQVWELLPTTVDAYHNMATAPLPGEGLYVLMSSVEVPLYTPGWNLFAYPVAGTRPVTEALQSLDGYYATVYGYDGLDPADPWKMYDVTVPDWVNDLGQLEFGRGYWISVTQPITLYLKGEESEGVAREADLTSMGSPPATYYGVVEGGEDFVPAAGMPLAAQVDGNLCGQSLTQQVDDQVVYSVNVLADGPAGPAGCGQLGRTVAFKVGARPMIPTAAWDDRRVWELPLRPGQLHVIYLPLVVKSW